MRFQYTARFNRSFEAAPELIQRTFLRKATLLLHNLQHPSLHAKRFPERGHDIWQARVSKDWRFYFTIEGDTYSLLDLIKHPK